MLFDLAVLLNYFLFSLIVFTLIFLFARRMVLFPIKKIYENRTEEYRRRLEAALEILRRDEQKLTPFTYAGTIGRRALEDSILLMMEKGDEDEKRILSRIYKEAGLVDFQIKMLWSNDVWQRRIAADRLGRSLSRSASVELLLALKDTDEDVKLLAARSLGILKIDEAAPYIISLFKDFKEENRPLLGDILLHLGTRALPAFHKGLSEKHDITTYWVLRTLSEAEIPEDFYGLESLCRNIVRELKNPRDSIRAYAYTALAAAGRKEYFETIKEGMRDKSPAVREKAVKAISLLETKKRIRLLAEAAADPDWDVSQAAMEALIPAGKEAEKAVRGLLRHPKNIARKRAREILDYWSINEHV